MTTSNLSSALNTVSVPPLDSRFFSFALTTAALRPDFDSSALMTTIGAPLIMMTLPVRSSDASFIDYLLEVARLNVDGLCRGAGFHSKANDFS